MNVFLLFSGAIIGYYFIAIYNTLLKEKTMVEEGGDPLPTSAYVFLTIKHVIWGVIAYTGGAILPLSWFSGSLLDFFIAVGYVILTYVVSTLIEVLIRTVIVYFRVKALTKQQNKEETEGE